MVNNCYKYKVGMFGGSFDPLHVGHIHDIIRAACECEELYVMISWCEGRESVPKELRYRWIYQCTKHLKNVHILLVEDKAVSKEEYNTDYYWEKGANDIKMLIGKPIDAVYCGSDYRGTGRFESLYCPESEVVYFDRSEVPISSTDIRTWAYSNWDYIPKVCRPFYTKKVLVVGGESTGKSTLVENLAYAYNTNFLREIGRDVCEWCGNDENLMTSSDLEEILIRHKKEEYEAIKDSNRILFIDTDALTTKFYTELLVKDEGDRGKCCDIADALSKTNFYDMVLFIEPVNTFVQDGTRNEDIHKEREKYSHMLKLLYLNNNIPIITLSGSYLDNFNESKKYIEEKFGIKTVW